MYKLRIYAKRNARNAGALLREEHFKTQAEMDARYRELFEYEQGPFNPTAWQLDTTTNEYVRILGY